MGEFQESSIIDILKSRLDNYVKAISYVQKYDTSQVSILLEKAEKLKELRKKNQQGEEIDR